MYNILIFYVYVSFQQQLEYAKQTYNDGQLERFVDYIVLTHTQHLFIFKIVMIIIPNRFDR